MRRAPLLLAASAALALAACNNAPGNNSVAAAPTQGLPAPNAQAPGTPGAPVTAPANPNLAAQMQAEAQALQSTLPMRVDEVTQITAVTVEGTEAVYTLQISAPIPNPERAREAAQTHAQTQVCGNPAAAGLVRQGATMRYDYTDSAGASFTTRVASCP